MAKKIGCIALIAALTMAVMCISVSAQGTFNTELYYTGFTEDATSGSYTWAKITSFPQNLTKFSSVTKQYYLFFMFKTNQIIHDGSIIVVSLNLENQKPNLVEVRGAGQPTSLTLPTAESMTISNLKAISMNQNIIATTEREVDNYTQVTITYRASGYTSQYVIVSLMSIMRADTTANIKLARCELYEDLESAASSGATPDEMREVLDRWSEEELLPGIGNEVGNQLSEKLPEVWEVIEGANIEIGNSTIDEITSALGDQIAPFMEEAAQIRDSIHGGAGAVFNYSGVDCTIKFPAARNPFTGNSLLWPEYEINLAQYYYRIPSELRILISALLTLLISIGTIREVLDVINTLLIHREILTMPDDR